MKERTREEPRIVAAAERRMQAWALGQEIADRTLRIDRGERPVGQLGPYIPISRERLMEFISVWRGKTRPGSGVGYFEAME